MTKRPPNEEDLRAMFGLLEEVRIMLTHWAPGSQTPTEEIQQLRDENAQLKAVLNQCHAAMGQAIETGRSTDSLDAAMEAIDVALRRESYGHSERH